MDGQSETIDKMRTPQGKNRMVQEAGELMRLTKKDHQFIHSEGEGGENAKDKEDR